MPSLSTILSFATLCTALPSFTDLSKRTELPNESCSVVYTNPQGGVACRYPSHLTNSKGVMGSVITPSGTFENCQRECLRNPGCLANRWTADGTCILYAYGLKDMGFTPDPKSNEFFTDRSCFALKGLCLPHEGSFESTGSPDPVFRSTPHPWFKLAPGRSDDTSVFYQNENNLHHGPASNTSDGTHFMRSLVYNNYGDAGLYQKVNLAPNTRYIATMSYNFVYYQNYTPDQGEPTSYGLRLVTDDATLIDLQFPTSAAHNTWSKKTARFTTSADGATALYVVNFANGAALPNAKYTASFAIDAISITPA